MKISVIIPVYNSGEFLVEALRSIRENAFPDIDFELILVNDCSTDLRTLEILGQLGSGVRVINNETNVGPARARNIGIHASTGDWIAFLDSDDLWSKDSIAKRIRAIELIPYAQWLAGDFYEMPNDCELVRNNFHCDKNDPRYSIGSGIYEIHDSLSIVAKGYPILLGSMLIRRDLLDKVGGINERLLYGEDWYFSMALASYTRLYWLDEPLLSLRRHHDSLTKNVIRSARENYKAELAAMNDKRFLAVRKIIKWRLAGVIRVSVLKLINVGEFYEAFKLLIKLMYWAPTDWRSYSYTANALSSKISSMWRRKVC